MALSFWSSGQHGNKKRYNPWTYLTKPAAMKILDALFREGPMTLKQLSASTGLSTTTVSKHLHDLLEMQLLREVDVPEEDRRFKVEKFYEPSFPIFTQEDQKKVKMIQREIGEKVAEVVIENIRRFEEVFETTDARKRGWSFEDHAVRFYMLQPSYHSVLTRRGHLSDWPKRPGGNWWWVFGEEKPDEKQNR